MFNVPHNFTRPNGESVSGYDNPANAWMWPLDGFKDEVPIEQEPMPPVPFQLSKIKLGDAFEALGVIDQFESFIAAEPTRARRYRDAVTLASDDPMVLSACDYFGEKLGMTAEQIGALLEQCRSDSN